ncbi:hypothetical protein PAAG_12227 [Paracoccidioides lutzii Pb01]|uniref:Uncharacterized protein n=1 Tax=Paracoccidioides lutzii (strain ATCC MYA-826 / Pb01) TaxID=502779 RepID=A0A0A2VJP6_PARBA|nr:hypothetical protein PAAG_12227 [Paracoccidioides lutzii Pb01]KGQ01099.1 hypothetical protein PAAG_12227 [Paracoccidioides lutzii Pb01]
MRWKQLTECDGEQRGNGVHGTIGEICLVTAPRAKQLSNEADQLASTLRSLGGASPGSSKDWDAEDDERALQRSDWPLRPAIDDSAVITLDVVQLERLPECFSRNLRETGVELVLSGRGIMMALVELHYPKEEQILAPKCTPA